MVRTTACEALKAEKCIELRYDGFTRIVEIHAVGITKDGNSVMRVWQVRGGSNRGERSGFKLFRLDETFTAHIIDEKSNAPRSGYKRGDAAMATIICEV